ncbi:MAG: oligosaccharide flippase family protein [Lachnospiraceae bacterium]|nr:oligosaccharide flippase family protein [Lachnospiraceae bacterium]
MFESKSKTGKAKLFIENFVVYGVGGIISKIIPLIMLPIITRLMPNTTYFGISDLSNTVASFGSALAVIGMYDAMYRMYFEDAGDEFRKKVCSTTIVFTVTMSILVTIIMIAGQRTIAKYFFGDVKYSYLVYITAMTTLVTSTNQIVAAPTRMQNKRKVFLITNTVGPVLSYTISIPLILQGYYVTALPLAALISGATMEATFWLLNRKCFEFKLFDKKLLKQLLVIAVPLFPNFLVYWIFNSSDKLMITNILNVGEAGIYSIGAKLGHASQLIYTAFAGGWQYFAFSTMNEDDQVASNSKVFEYLGAISFFCSVFIFAFSKLIYQVLFVGDYVAGYIVAPYLFLSPLMQMLFQVACNQFIVIKKTWPNMFILVGGAVINVLLNLVLIPLIGIEGAAIATLIGYICSDIICCIVLCKMNLMVISKRFIIMVGLILTYVLVWRFLTIESTLLSFLLSCVASIGITILYRNEGIIILSKLRKKV